MVGIASHAVKLLVEAGFTPLDAIRIATLEGAKFLGVDDRVGSTEQGKEADFLIVRGDPSTNIQDLSNVSHVFPNGSFMTRTRCFRGNRASRLALIGLWSSRRQAAIASLAKPPLRSIRFALWAAEAPVPPGSAMFIKRYTAELHDCVAALSTDFVAERPRGWHVVGRQALRDAMRSIAHRRRDFGSDGSMDRIATQLNAIPESPARRR